MTILACSVARSVSDVVAGRATVARRQ